MPTVQERTLSKIDGVNMQHRLTADIRLRIAPPKFGKAELRMSAKRYTQFHLGEDNLWIKENQTKILTL